MQYNSGVQPQINQGRALIQTILLQHMTERPGKNYGVFSLDTLK